MVNRVHQSPISVVAVALVTTFLLLHDVIFFGRSLLSSDYTSVLQDETVRSTSKAIWHIGNAQAPTYRRHDIGTSAWQFEPSIHFMSRAIWDGETPYWNPHVATGALGPETLADMKFSGATLATAALGGSSLAYHAVLFLFIFGSSFAVLRLSTLHFCMSGLGSIAALAAFLLGGFAQVHFINALFIFIYLTTPIVLLALLNLARAQSASSFLLAVVANILLLSFTFTPALVLATAFTHSLCLLYILCEVESGKRLRAVAFANIAVPLISLLVLAPLYLPIVASFGDTVTLDQYLQRDPRGLRLSSLPKLLVPAGYSASTLATLGAIPGVLAIVGASSNGPYRAIRWGLLSLSALGLAAAFQFWPVSTLLEQVPILRTIRPSFWNYLYCIPVPFLVGFGVSAIQRGENLSILVIFAAAAALAAFAFDFVFFSKNAPKWQHWNFTVAAALFLSVLLALMAARNKAFAPAASYALVSLLVVDGLFSTNFLRPPRLDKGAEPPALLAWLRDELGGPHGARVLNIGRASLYPDWATALGIAQVGTMNISELRWFARFYRDYIGHEWRLLSLGRSPSYVPRFTDATLDVLGVRFVVVDKNQRGALKRLGELGYPIVGEDSIRLVFENQKYADRAQVVGTLLEAPGIPAAQNAATTTDRKLLDIAKQLGVSNHPGRAGRAAVTEYRNGRVTMRVKLDRSGILVLSDAWHPRWTATVDGKEAYIGVVNLAFRAIAIPPGSHTVVMAYSPHLFLASLALSVAGVAGSTGLAFGLWRRRRNGASF
jgi:hypothetical protein